MLRSTSALLLTRLATTTIRAMAAIDSSGCAGECYADGTYQRGARLRLGLVRHGESMNNVHEAQGTYKTGRVADPELSPRGRRQAEVLGAFLGNKSKAEFFGLGKIDEIWVSPHRRTLTPPRRRRRRRASRHAYIPRSTRPAASTTPTTRTTPSWHEAA